MTNKTPVKARNKQLAQKIIDSDTDSLDVLDCLLTAEELINPVKINWNELSKTRGYKSLKKEIQDCGKRYGSKESYYKKFQWIIGRAKHYAHNTGKPIAQVLNEWEEDRTYCIDNYYQEYNQPKFKKSL